MSLADRAKWDVKWQGAEPGAASPSLEAFAELLPTRGHALDVAGGCGRNSLWLLQRGLAVTLVDISEVGLAVARSHAAGLPFTTVQRDLDVEPLPDGPFDAIVCIAFLHRALYRAFPSLLAPGGTLLVVHPTVTNLERHASPPREFLLERGELAGFFQGLDIVHSDESWQGERHHARLVARRRAE